MRSGGGYTWRIQGRYRYERWRRNLPRRRRSLSTIPFESTSVMPHEWTNQRRGRRGRSILLRLSLHLSLLEFISGPQGGVAHQFSIVRIVGS
ncbi:unnamed protein product [Calypogeia fissa]